MSSDKINKPFGVGAGPGQEGQGNDGQPHPVKAAREKPDWLSKYLPGGKYHELVADHDPEVGTHEPVDLEARKVFRQRRADLKAFYQGLPADKRAPGPTECQGAECTGTIWYWQGQLFAPTPAPGAGWVQVPCRCGNGQSRAKLRAVDPWE
jgi:hypothetical protein